MLQSELIQDVESRYELYRLDAGARSAIKQIWPTIAPHLEKAVDAILDATEKLPRLSSVVKQHRDLIKKLEMSHLQALLSGDLDTHYFVSCRKTVEQEAALGFDARLRSTAGNYVLRAALRALAYKHKFSRATLVKNVELVSQVIAFDVANAMTLHRQAAEANAETRRQAIDAAITDFGGAIGEVLEAIKDASSSLTTTCTTMRELADDTLRRMAVASTASAETTQRVQITGATTEELSASIQHIGQEASRGLEMAKAAVGDTQRTQQAILSLNNTAERIGLYRQHHFHNRVADQSFGAQRDDRGGARRRRRQGVRGGRFRSEGTRQSDRARHRGNIAAGRRHSGRHQEIGR